MTAAQAAHAAAVSRQHMHNVINSGVFSTAKRLGAYEYQETLPTGETVQRVHQGFVVIEKSEFEEWAARRNPVEQVEEVPTS